MKSKPDTAFLSLCSPLHPQPEKGDVSAILDFSKWAFWKQHLPETLVLEGVNQFANKNEQYLPAMMERFHTVWRNIPPLLRISGRCDRVHNACHVSCVVTAPAGEIIATASVMVSRTRLAVSTQACQGTRPDLPVWVMEKIEDNRPLTAPVSFCFNGKHPLFTGHFPGYAVVPGSMLAEIVLVRMMRFYPRLRDVALTRVKFILPVLPDIPCCLTLQGSADAGDITFFICCCNSGKRMATGKMTFTLIEGE